jgi:pimeloyl-ACP methyl ester carboxylesterase
VILISPYTSICDVARDKFPRLGWLCPEVFDNASIVSSEVLAQVPILFIHGQTDSVIDIEHSRKLSACSKSKYKRIIVVEDVGHNFHETHSAILQQILDFIPN